MTVDEAFAFVKKYIKDNFDYATINAIYRNIKDGNADEHSTVLVNVQNILISEAEKYAKQNPVLSLAFLTFTSNKHLSTVDYYRRSMIIDYCLSLVNYETIQCFPNWLFCRWKHLMADEKEAYYINVNNGMKIIIKRDCKTVTWDILFVKDKKVIKSDKITLYVLTKYKIKSEVLKTDDGYLILLDTPFVSYNILWTEQKMEVTKNERHNQIA